MYEQFCVNQKNISEHLMHFKIWCIKPGLLVTSSDWTRPQLLTAWWTSELQSSGNSTNKAAIERNWRWRASPSLSLTDTWPGSLGLIQGRGAGVYHSLAVSLCGPCSFGPEIPEWLSKPNSGGLQLCLLMFTLPGCHLRSMATQIPFWILGGGKIFSQADWLGTK